MILKIKISNFLKLSDNLYYFNLLSAASQYIGAAKLRTAGGGINKSEL